MAASQETVPEEALYWPIQVTSAGRVSVRRGVRSHNPGVGQGYRVGQQSSGRGGLPVHGLQGGRMEHRDLGGVDGGELGSAVGGVGGRGRQVGEGQAGDCQRPGSHRFGYRAAPIIPALAIVGLIDVNLHGAARAGSPGDCAGSAGRRQDERRSNSIIGAVGQVDAQSAIRVDRIFGDGVPKSCGGIHSHPVRAVMRNKVPRSKGVVPGLHAEMHPTVGISQRLEAGRHADHIVLNHIIGGISGDAEALEPDAVLVPGDKIPLCQRCPANPIIIRVLPEIDAIPAVWQGGQTAGVEANVIPGYVIVVRVIIIIPSPSLPEMILRWPSVSPPIRFPSA